MQDLFERVELATFMKEEAKALSNRADVGMQMVAVQIASFLKLFATEYVLKAGLLSSYDPGQPNSGDTAKGQDTLLRAYALLTVSAALGLRDLAGRLGITEDFAEVDLLVSWYRRRWPR